MVTVIGLTLFAYLLFGCVKLVYENYRINQETKRLQTDVANLQEYTGQLQSLLAYYRTDSFRDKQARQRLNQTKPGERVVAVPIQPGEEVSTITQAGPAVQPPAAPSNLQQWKDYFFAARS